MARKWRWTSSLRKGIGKGRRSALVVVLVVVVVVNLRSWEDVTVVVVTS